MKGNSTSEKVSTFSRFFTSRIQSVRCCSCSNPSLGRTCRLPGPSSSYACSRISTICEGTLSRFYACSCNEVLPNVCGKRLFLIACKDRRKRPQQLHSVTLLDRKSVV